MILRQRFTYAEISLIRDCSPISTPTPPIIEPIEEELLDIDDIFEEMLVHQSNVQPIIKNLNFASIKLSPKPKSGKKTKYFYLDPETPDSDYVSFQTLTKRPFYTTKERHIKKHYGNPFASIFLHTHERSIELRGNKLYLKTYYQYKKREHNWKYFRKNSRSVSFTIDLVKGDFTIGERTMNGRTKNVRFRKNSFTSLENLITYNTFFKYRNKLPTSVEGEVRDGFLNTFNDYDFVKELKKFIPEIPNFIDEISDKRYTIKGFVDFFINKKKIKAPNDYVTLITKYYPTEKFLKKNDRKLVQSILDSFGIKSKLLVRIGHENPTLNYYEFSLICGLFGKNYTKYIGNLSPDTFYIFCESEGFIPLKQRQFPITYNFVNGINEDEKENIIKIINSLSVNSKEQPVRVGNIFQLFKDHFDMIDKIREYIPDYKMTSTNYDAFHNEHLELSKMSRLIKKAWTTEYQFDGRMVRHVEEKIEYVKEGVEYVFNPVILKREEEYVEEGSFMYHCVATYANKETSIVISLRLNHGLDRVTCEFDKKSGNCLQERHFSNKIPPDYFEDALFVLKNRVKRFAGQRLLDHIDIKKVKIKINGIEVNKKEQVNVFDELFGDNFEF
jgi:hypothetical protein